MPFFPAAKQHGQVRLYVSHSAPSLGGTVEWFIVEPRDEPEQLALQVDSLRRQGRTVRELSVEPYEGLFTC